jgi:hypothetical protein
MNYWLIHFELDDLLQTKGHVKSPSLKTPPLRCSTSPGLLAYRLRCLSDNLAGLVRDLPEAQGQTATELLRARDAIWFAAGQIKSAASTSNPQSHYGQPS